MLSDDDVWFLFSLGLTGSMLLLTVLIMTGLWRILVLFSAIVTCLVCFYKAYTYKGSQNFTIRGNVDLSYFEKPNWDSEPLYQRNRFTGKWEVAPESKIQTNPATQETMVQEMPKKEFVLDTTKLLKTPLHKECTLCPEEIEYLKKWNYQRKEFVPLGEIRRQPFWIKECKPEGLEHTFVVHSIAHLLPPWADVRTYFTQLPDVVFTFDSKEYALEIETPLFLRK